MQRCPLQANKPIMSYKTVGQEIPLYIIKHHHHHQSTEEGKKGAKENKTGLQKFYQKHK